MFKPALMMTAPPTSSFTAFEKLGLHQDIFKTITSTDSKYHRTLYGNVLLAGGNTMFDGLGMRLKKEIKRCIPGGLGEGVKVGLREV